MIGSVFLVHFDGNRKNTIIACTYLRQGKTVFILYFLQDEEFRKNLKESLEIIEESYKRYKS